ncbi:hypothetical protein [Niallia sp. Krafla_26]|uniref:hypothetical protein n=1 Tax=Niallia sp. Krafla_26 TaxID=3064703 RepID=UPI003D17997F
MCRGSNGQDRMNKLEQSPIEEFKRTRTEEKAGTESDRGAQTDKNGRKSWCRVR